MNNKDIEAKDTPFIPNTTSPNVYNVLPYGINAELLVRNKSKNGNFTDNLQVDGGDLIEFKLSITNTSVTETLNPVSSTINISPPLLNALDVSNITLVTQTCSFNQMYLYISNLAPGATAIVTYVYIAMYSGNLVFSGYINTKKRNFYFNKFPSISIINAPNSNGYGMLRMTKSQKFVQSNSRGYTTDSLDVLNGDIIEFQLYIGNNNSNNTNVYNLKLVDKLNNNLSYIEGSLKGTYTAKPSGNLTSYNTIWGNADFNSTNATTVNGKLVGGSIEWTMSVLDSYSVNSTNAYEAYLYFQCEVVG